MTRTVVALYDDFASANAAVRELVDNGFSREDISLMANDTAGEYGRMENQGNVPTSNAAEGAGVGAGVGAVVGGLGGLLIGLGALTIPGIGPVIAAGPLAAALTGLAGAGAGAVAGGVTGGVLGALIDMGIPHETANYYAEGIRRGGTLLTLRSPDHMTDRAVEIMNRQNPVDINQRATEWRSSGWTGFDPNAQPFHREPSRTDQAAGQGTRSSMETDRSPETEHPMATGQSVDTGRYIAAGQRVEPDQPYNTGTGSENQMPSSSARSNAEENWPEDTQFERNTAATNDMVRTGRENSPTSDNLNNASYRNTDVTTDYADFSAYEVDFRNHFATTMYGTGYTYEQYQPAYRYGYDLATNSRYRGRNWEEIEPEAQRYWDERNPGTWDQIKGAVHHAWDEIKDVVS